MNCVTQLFAARARCIASVCTSIHRTMTAIQYRPIYLRLEENIRVGVNSHQYVESMQPHRHYSDTAHGEPTQTADEKEQPPMKSWWAHLSEEAQQEVESRSESSDMVESRLELPADADVLYEKVLIEVMAHDPEVLKSYASYAVEAASLLNITWSSWKPPKIIDKWTLLKSKHIHGKYHKVQYEARTHFHCISLSMLTGSTADTYLEYIQRNLPEGVAMKVNKTRLEAFPDHIQEFIEEKQDVIQKSGTEETGTGS